MNESVHKGHRERQKKKFAQYGLESFTDVEALELLLYYAIPRCDTNALAHGLLSRFGSFCGVMEAEVSELAAVPGIGESAAALLHLVPELNRRYLRAERTRGTTLPDGESACNYFMPRFAYCADEVAMLVTLDSAMRVIRCHTLSAGMSNQVFVSSREIMDCALRDNAAKVILAHNHISGLALPSMADLKATTQIKNALALIGVDLVDHIVVSDGYSVSMRDSGWGKTEETEKSDR